MILDDQKKLISKLAIEYWRILKSFERNLSSLPNSNSASSTIRNSERKFNNILAESELRIVNYEGETYSPNLPLTAINADEFEENNGLYISQMIEPVIVDNDEVINLGKAILARKGD